MSFFDSLSGFAKSAAPFIPFAGPIVDKVFGVPTPDQRSGAELGAEHKAFQDVAFEGTNSWERLGGGVSGGAVQSAEVGAKNAAAMQRSELANRSSIADQTNRAHVTAASIGASPAEKQAALAAVEQPSRIERNQAESASSRYDVEQRRQLLPYEKFGKVAAGVRDAAFGLTPLGMGLGALDKFGKGSIGFHGRRRD